MDRVPVESSNLASVGYDAAQRVLEVEFKGSGVYQYASVAPETHAALVAAPSIGGYFHTHIKRQYSARKVAPSPEPA